MWWWNWHWDGWGYGFGVTLGAMVLLAIFVVPAFLFLLNLRDLLEQVGERNRAMPSGHVWLNFIPVFGLGWFIYTVVKVRDSLQAEYRSRGWPVTDDQGYSVGLAAGIAGVATLVLGWSPFFGWLIGLAWLVCLVIYWVKTAALRNRLSTAATPHGAAPIPPPAGRGQQGLSPVEAGAHDPGCDSSGADGRCPGCGAVCDPGDRFCRACGRRL